MRLLACKAQLAAPRCGSLRAVCCRVAGTQVSIASCKCLSIPLSGILHALLKIVDGFSNVKGKFIFVAFLRQVYVHIQVWAACNPRYPALPQPPERL